MCNKELYFRKFLKPIFRYTFEGNNALARTQKTETNKRLSLENHRVQKRSGFVLLCLYFWTIIRIKCSDFFKLSCVSFCTSFPYSMSFPFCFLNSFFASWQPLYHIYLIYDFDAMLISRFKLENSEEHFGVFLSVWTNKSEELTEIRGFQSRNADFYTTEFWPLEFGPCDYLRKLPSNRWYSKCFSFIKDFRRH